MDKTTKQYIEKLKELIKMVSPHGAEFWGKESDKYLRLVKQIASLEQQIEAEEKWQNMTPIERMKAKGLIDMSYKPYEPPDEVDDTLLGLDGEETWLP